MYPKDLKELIKNCLTPPYFFLSSALFLGWSLGANDAANVFGTAVNSRMVSFTTAALISGVFVILGVFFSSTDPSMALGKLGAVNATGGSFMAALSSGFTIYFMTRYALPVSTTQAIVSAIVGWNLFSDSYTEFSSLTQILSTWVKRPILAGLISAHIFLLAQIFVCKIPIGLIRLDGYTRFALILSGALGAYSLGANNITNVIRCFCFCKTLFRNSTGMRLQYFFNPTAVLGGRTRDRGWSIYLFQKSNYDGW